MSNRFDYRKLSSLILQHLQSFPGHADFVAQHNNKNKITHPQQYGITLQSYSNSRLISNQMSKNIDKIDVDIPFFKVDEDEQSPKFGNKKIVDKKPSGAGKYGQSQIAFIKQAADKQALASQNKIISRSELSKHNTKKSAWMSLKGIVYDVTTYIKHHPGGDIILDGCGRQSSSLFNEHHPWVNAKNILSKWTLGRLQD